MTQATIANPGEWQTHFGRGVALETLLREEEAIEEYERALALDPNNLHCLINLAGCEFRNSNLARAERLARQAIAVHGDHTRSLDRLGVILERQHKYVEAMALLRSAQQLEEAGDSEASAFVNLGIVYRNLDRIQDAIDVFENALVRSPHLGAHGHYALALLAAGRFAEGWRQHECRWANRPFLELRPNFGKPVWAGQDLRNRSLLVLSEQGVGDIIQFVRYIPLLVAAGANVILVVHPQAVALAHLFLGVDTVLVPGDPVPEFDYYVHLLSLPKVFGTDLASIPNQIPYVLLNDDCQDWKGRFSPNLNVGLVWAGSPEHKRDTFRSMHFQHLAQLLRVPRFTFYSLQKGDATSQAAEYFENGRLHDIGTDLHDFTDTAAAIQELDLVISVDTAVAHLAGALGKPVWILLPKPCDWRWLEDRADSPWYPTARLFRQSQLGDWSGVVSDVESALDAFEVSEDCPVVASNVVAFPSPSRRIPDACDATELTLARVCETRAGIFQYRPGCAEGDGIEWYGEHLQLELQTFLGLVAPTSIILEIGSGFGSHAIQIARFLDEAGHLLLYEHSEYSFNVLQNNLSINRVGNVTVLKPDITKQAAENEATSESSHGAVLLLDSLRLEALDWIKVAESSSIESTLTYGEELIWKLRPKLFFRCLDDESANATAHHAKRYGYRCWKVITPAFNPGNFNNRTSPEIAGGVVVNLVGAPEEAAVVLPGVSDEI